MKAKKQPELNVDEQLARGEACDSIRRPLSLRVVTEQACKKRKGAKEKCKATFEWKPHLHLQVFSDFHMMLK